MEETMQGEKSDHDDRDERIRQRAYSIWLAAGQPHGEHEAHWGQATQEIGVDPGDLPVAPENDDTVRNGLDSPGTGDGKGSTDRGAPVPGSNGTGRR